MSATPTTTKLGPDQGRLHDLMRRLAEATSSEAPILSVYADVRPEAQGGQPGERNELVIVRDRLNAALEAGQVDELVIDETAPIDGDLRAELVRQASLTDATVEIVSEHEGLRRFEGVGATLRYRI